MKAAYIGLLIAVCTLIGLAVPLSAAAEEVNVNTVQVIPPGGNSCAPLQVLNVHPYIVDNAVHSYDVTVNDPSYYVVISSIGDTAYTFRYVSRWMNSDGSVRQHVDVQTTPIGTSLPITLTLLSAKTGQPVCMSVISFSVAGSGPMHTPGQGSTVPHTPPTPVIPPHPTSGSGSTTSTSTGSTSVVRGSGIALGDICAQNGSLELWFFLITLYLIGAAAIALRDPLPSRPLYYTVLLLLVPAIILLAFWAFATVCRGPQWVPVVVFIIAIASLLAALWEREPAARMVELAPIPKKELLSGPSNTV
ncbi:MAG: hypothetical protein JWM46_584 [Candidatus Kaiserbacteria bacterium]|nr:hypothetical protein [Candidatus Kaiserbacteria bacterium]